MRRNNRRNQIIFLIILVVAIAGLSIAYAALSTSLTISGSGNVVAASWDIDLAFSESGSTTLGDASYTKPTIEGTTISGYTVTLTKPGDAFYFTVNATNNGTFDATLDSIACSTPTCTSSGANTADADLVCNNLIFEAIQGTYDETTKTWPIFIRIVYNEEATAVPSTEVSISNLVTTLTFVQSE